MDDLISGSTVLQAVAVVVVPALPTLWVKMTLEKMFESASVGCGLRCPLFLSNYPAHVWAKDV